MKFYEWMTQNKDSEFTELSSDLGMSTDEDTAMLENQLDQWVTRLMGLLQSAPSEKKQKLIEKVITNIKTFVSN